MSRRFAVPAALLAAAAVPVGASAAKHPGVHAQKVSINVTDNPVVTGEPLTIYGQLTAAKPGNRLVVLYHRIAGQDRFTVVSKTHTSASGFYTFNRADGIVRTNRNWFVKAATARSRTIHEGVFAELTLNSSTNSALTNHVVSFTGKVTPGRVHRGDRVFLQRQVGNEGDNWKTVDAGRVRAGGRYTINHKFRQPGSKTVRTVLRRDRYNLRSESSPVSIEIQQAQRPNFTITADDQQIDAGQTVTISGKLAPPNNAMQAVTLYARTPNQGYHKVAVAATDANGNYSFTPQSPVNNTAYQVRNGNGRHSAQLFVGVRDVVSVAADKTSAKVGDRITFTGGVLPNKSGHVIYLQRLGDDGQFHTIEAGRVDSLSRYTLSHTVRVAGDKQFRVLIPGGPYNERGVSDVVHVTVSA